MFVDEAEIEVKAGSGGNGSASFRREKYIPKGGPDGGDGGNGGSIFISVKENLHGLANAKAKRLFKAGNGEPGRSKKQHGKNGEDLTIEVPPGTVVFDKETRELLVDLKNSSEPIKIASGGKGGLGNVHFASSTNRTPREFTEGTKGAQKKLKLIVKHMADVGLVGLPNAGKSTLLGVLTAARPEVGNYPFTTLEPHLGRLILDSQQLTIADIPGLIKGASKGKGLGHKFLRHIQRVKTIVHLVSSESQDPISDYEDIRRELAQFDEKILEVPEVVVISKSDLVPASQLKQTEQELTEYLKEKPLIISSKEKAGINTLKKRINSLTDSD